MLKTATHQDNVLNADLRRISDELEKKADKKDTYTKSEVDAKIKTLEDKITALETRIQTLESA